MATANPIGEDNYELELNRVRNKIITTFHELTKCLKKREQELLKELDGILACYHSYKLESDKMREKKIALQHTKSLISQQSNLSPIQDVHEDLIARLNTELETIAIPNQPQMMYFVCNTNILDEVKKLGELVQRERTEVDYKSKINPVVSVCDYGRGLNNLYGPEAVTVDDTTGNIFVADTLNNCVKVFDDSGRIIYKFGGEKVEGKMHEPRGLSIHGNNIVISLSNHFILNYQLNGKFISRIGKSGKGKLEFNLPRGLTFNQNGDLYICDSNNNRVQILSKEFVFKDQFGQNSLKKPRDVKLTRRYIYILDESNPCLHLFDYNLILQKSVLSRGKGLQLIEPLSCYIDDSDNILIPDNQGSICIFNPEFELVHRISIACPNAVTVDKQGGIIVVCGNGDKRLYIF